MSEKNKEILEEVLDEKNLRKLSGKELEKIAKENNYDIAKIMQQYRLRIESADLTKIKKK